VARPASASMARRASVESEMGRYLETVMEKPLLLRKASGLLGPFVGQTEQQLAAAFTEAKQKNANLMIGEADSFLGSRSAAQQQWKVSHVNELLVQMEESNGILIMSTNFMEHLDSVALRRFDFKICFGYLGFDQSWPFFNCLLGMHQVTTFGCSGCSRVRDSAETPASADTWRLRQRRATRQAIGRTADT